MKNASYIMTSIILLCNLTINGSDNESFDPENSPFSYLYLKNRFIHCYQTEDKKDILYPTETGWQLCSTAQLNTELHNEYEKAKNKKAYLQKLEKYEFVTPPICPPTKKRKVQQNNSTPLKRNHFITANAPKNAYESPTEFNAILKKIENDYELNEALKNLSFNCPLTFPCPDSTNAQLEVKNINHDRKYCPAKASQSRVCNTIPLQPSSKINMQAISEIDTNDLTTKKL